MKLVENNNYNNGVSVLGIFENFGELCDYLFTNRNFDMCRWAYPEFLEYIQESADGISVLDVFEFYNVRNASHMADLFQAGKVVVYEAFNEANGESKIIVTDDLIIPDINDLLAVYGETTMPSGVKNVFEVIE